MTTKTTGEEFKRFYTTKELWEENDRYHEDEIVTVNGKEVDEYEFDYSDIPDEAIVTVHGGIVLGNGFDGDEPSFEAYFKRWKKKQSTATIIVTCHVGKVDEIKAAIKAAGGKTT